MIDQKESLLKKVKKIPVPEPGTGEIVILPSVEALHWWMQTNHLKADRWYGGTLIVSRIKPQEAVSVSVEES